MRMRSGHIWSVVRLGLAILFGVQTMLIPGLHRHPEGSHDAAAGASGSSAISSTCADPAGHGVRLGICASPEPGSHAGTNDCPACMFLKNFQGGAGVGKIPVPVLSPDNHALPPENLRCTSHTVVAAFPRGPPTA